jgi:hypothetical protein
MKDANGEIYSSTSQLGNYWNNMRSRFTSDALGNPMTTAMFNNMEIGYEVRSL